MNNYIDSVKKQFYYYKQLGELTIDQLSEDDLIYQPTTESNSISIIVQHLVGNMLSRWTDFLNSDGEKEWRKRDEEFEPIFSSKKQLLENWEKGWDCLFEALNQLHTPEDLEQVIYIRNQGHTILEAINRQLAHYPYHIGQIVFIGKMIRNQNWKSLSIPKNQSSTYNNSKFAKKRSTSHFTDEYINKKGNQY